MLDHIKLQNILVIDIETVPAIPELRMLSDEMQDLWELKEGRNCPDDLMPQQHYFNRAGIFAEFGKIICISAGVFHYDKESEKLQLRIKSFHGKDEYALLQQFCELLNIYFNNPGVHTFSGHNIKEFDIPYLCRRMLVNGCILPKLLDISGRKPWEVNFVDTLQLWKFGDYKNYVSLRLLAAIFGIPTPKDDIDGSDVGSVYWEDDDLPRIVEYCQKDVLTSAQLLLKFKGMPLLGNGQVVINEEVA